MCCGGAQGISFTTIGAAAVAASRGAYSDAGADEERKDECCRLGIRAASDGEWKEDRRDGLTI